jgi:energy-coupling factor transporter ATP-binding protein EcfA2
MRYNDAMLKSVHLENFKLHEDTTIEAAPITVFIGPNNSGKSSVFQALLALRQALSQQRSTFLGPVRRLDTSPTNPFMYVASESVNIGEFSDVVRGGRGTLSISVSGDLESPRPATELGRVQASLEVRIGDNTLTDHEGEFRAHIGGFKWGLLGPTERSEGFRLSIQNPPGSITFYPLADFRLLQITTVQAPPPNPPEIQRRLAEIGSTVAGVPAQLLNSLHHVFALRGFEEWGYPLPQERAQQLERLCLPDRAVALVTTIASNARFKKELSDRLSELLKIGIDIEYVGSNRVKIFATEEKRGDGQRLFVNEGSGANQLPFILVPVALTPKNETVLMSEPEAHLHPKRQCDLTRMLLTVAKNENIQFFIETHSEHVLHTILNAVAKGEWNRDEVALHYFQNKNGTAEVSKREINRFGQVDGGLPDFFEQSLAELTDYLKAVSRA